MNAPTTALVAVDQSSFSLFTPRLMSAFLEHLSIRGNVRQACRAAGVSSQTAYRARRKSPQLARLWDAAIVSARGHTEEALAERALNGTEEAVFYHGEEVATRIRHDCRLLLAHLARLDKLAERADVSATLPLLDEAIEGLAEGREPAEILPPEISHMDSAPCAPSMRTPPEETQQEPEQESEQEPEPELRQETDEDWLAYCARVRRMERARPAGAAKPHEMCKDPRIDLEMVQLEAFEAGVAEWWTIASEEEMCKSVCQAYEPQEDDPASSGDGAAQAD